MTREQALATLGADVKTDADGSVWSGEGEYFSFNARPFDASRDPMEERDAPPTACLDGEFTAEQLEALAWLMVNKAHDKECDALRATTIEDLKAIMVTCQFDYEYNVALEALIDKLKPRA